MIRIELSDLQRAELEEAFKTSQDRRLRDRCQAVLMSARGKSRQDVAQDLMSSARSVQRWLSAYHSKGLAGLERKRARGRETKIPAELAPQILEWIEKGPAGCGLNRANWSYEELRDHLYKQTGIRVGVRTLGNFCARRGVRPYRPTYRFLRGDADKQAKAREEVAELKRGL